MNKKLTYLCIISCITLTACGNQSDDIKSWMNAEKNKAAQNKKLPLLPEVEKYTSYSYKSSETANPFVLKGLILDEKEENSPDLNRRKEELESYNMESLSMVGFFKQNGKPFALIKTKNNMTYQVTSGNHLGPNFGEVIDIQENGLVLKEKFRNQGGKGWEEKELFIELKEKN